MRLCRERFNKQFTFEGNFSLLIQKKGLRILYWANFLHIYQPPTQTKKILERVTNESYRRVVSELKNAKSARLTLNITGGLTELLVENGFSDVIEDLKLLAERGQVELTESAIFHPLLPRLPDAEIIRQIKLNHEKNRAYFGSIYNPRGFFPPEASYDRRIAKIVADLGYEWILAEELSYSGQFGTVKWDRCYEIEDIGIQIFFREREASFKILSGQLGTAKLFEDYLGERLGSDEYMLTAMDGETFGHHRPGMEKLLFEIYRSPKVKTVTISELPQLFKQREVVETRASTWALMEKDMERNMPFARWDDPNNEIQQMQWRLTEIAIASVNNSKLKPKAHPTREVGNVVAAETARWLKARELLDKALHSDQYWWASARPWWSLEMIERGAKELMEVVLSVPDASEKEKRQARILYRDIIFTGFEWQRIGRVEEISREEDEEIRERTDVGFPRLPREELQKMIGTIESEMLAVAKKREYERAAQLRDRIDELKSYMDD